MDRAVRIENRPKFPVFCPDTQETFYNYPDYLKGDHWRGVKERYFASKLKKECNVCKRKDRLDLHHKSYKRFGNERLTDLVYLCRTCHSRLHESINHVGDKRKLNTWNSVRKMRKRHERKQSD